MSNNPLPGDLPSVSSNDPKTDPNATAPVPIPSNTESALTSPQSAAPGTATPEAAPHPDRPEIGAETNPPSQPLSPGAPSLTSSVLETALADKTPGFQPRITTYKQLFNLVDSYSVVQWVRTAVELGLADHLAAGPRTVDELAELTSSDVQLLYRLMRALAGIGVFVEQSEKRFASNEIGSYLAQNSPKSLSSLFQIIAGPLWWLPWVDLTKIVRTGTSGVKVRYNTDLFTYLESHPAESQFFRGAVHSLSNFDLEEIVASYDFPETGIIADIGGGVGTLLAKILEARPRAQGLLFDAVGPISSARQQFEKSGLARRCIFQVGNFLESFPQNATLYVLKSVLHNWSEEKALTLLNNCRATMPSDAKLLLVDVVVPTANQASEAWYWDMQMMVLFGNAGERTEEEFRALLEKAKFKITTIKKIPNSQNSLIEAIPV